MLYSKVRGLLPTYLECLQGERDRKSNIEKNKNLSRQKNWKKLTNEQ